MKRLAGAFLMLLALAACAAAPRAVVELDRGEIDPLAVAGAKATVLIFTRIDCPISNKYAPEIARLAELWQPRGVAFFLVHVDRDPDESAVRAHVRDHGLPCRVLLDRRRELVDLVGASTTPQVAVFAPDRRIVYDGRIDDRFADLGVMRAHPTTHELEDALAAVLAGRDPAVRRTQAVGCAIEGAGPATASVFVFVTRHAEKATNDPRDPDLSDAGRARAEALAALLGPSGVTHLFATELKRTQQTLAPLAAKCGVEVAIVGAGDTEALAARLLALPAGAVAVVAGHSNTVPALVRRLGGSLAGTITTDRGEMLPDPEYGRLMLVVLPPPDAPDRAASRTLELSVGAR